MKSNKEKVLQLYFDEKLKQVDIAKMLNISTNAVSKIVKNDARYEKEKKARKELNKIKHNKEIQKRVEKKRKEQANTDNYILKRMHQQASSELSDGRKPMNNRVFRNWNPSIYRYNEKSHSFILKSGIVVGADVPKKISWK